MPSVAAIADWCKQPAARAAAIYLVLASLWIFASDGLLGLIVSDPVVLARIGMAKGGVFVAVTTAVLYLLLSTWSNRAERAPRPPAPAAARSAQAGLIGLIGLFAALAALVPLVGFGLAKLQEPRLERAALDDLRAIGELKAGQIESWLKEWRADAEALRVSVGFADSLEQWRRTGRPEAGRGIEGVLRSLQQVHRYEVEFLDAAGRHLPVAGTRADPDRALAPALLAAALRTREVQTSDLYRDASGQVRLDLAVPLVRDAAGRPETVAVAIMRAPVQQVLSRLVETWPTPSPSGESMLVRRDGDKVLFLTEPRHRQAVSASHHVPLDRDPKLPAAIGLQSPQPVSVRDGRDYRGVPVLAAVRPIEGTDWRLVTKLDREEVHAPLHELIRWVGLVALVAVATVAVVATLLWRQQQRASRLELAAQAAEKDKLLKLFYELPFMGMSMLSPATHRFLYVNDRLCEMLAYPRRALLGMCWPDIVDPDERAALLPALRRLTAGESEQLQVECRYRRQDGSTGIAEIDVRGARGADGRVDVLVAVVQDITERRQTEARTRQAATVFESTRDGVVIADLDSNILAVNKAFTDITGYAEAEAVGRKTNLQKSDRHGPEFYQALWASLAQTDQWQGEIWNRRKSGEVYPAWMTITTVRDRHDLPTHFVAVFSDISQIRRSEEQLARLAHYDPLTELPNRLLLQSRLAHALDRAERNDCRAAVLFIDLDGFKTVNDSLGHLAGDELLVKVAQRLRERTRDEDTLGRLGGDEFLLLLEPIGDAEEAAVVARDLLTALTQPFRLANGSDVHVGASIGISIFPDDSADAATLLRDADAAMYQAKERGRNRFCFYTADMNSNAVAQFELEAALRRALEREEFVLHFQPKVDLASGAVTGAEALIRWQREGAGIEPPARFIPLAEKSGLIEPIGAWVIDAACRQLRLWHAAGWPDLRVAVNVSSRQFRAGDLATLVARTLERHGVPAHCLELELTESMLMTDPEQTIAILSDLKRLGVGISLDDFGTGCSSFAYLSRFPLDTLKIDRSFVRDMIDEPQAAVIAAAIIDLGHRLRLKVVAEGVESEAQLDCLKQRGCDEMQGYYFARPLPAEAFGTLLREGAAAPTSDAGER